MNPLLDSFKDFALKKSIAGNTYIVGGAVRDMLSGLETKDIDLAVAGNALDISKEFADASGGTYVLLDSEFATARVVKNSFSLDISSIRGGSIISDLSDRDITVNAMAQPLCDWQASVNIIDPFGGRSDLRSGIIRMVSAANLVSDPLRILRVYRFSAALHAEVEKETRCAAREHGGLLQVIAVERVAMELRHILALPDSHKIMKVMEEDGIMAVLLPEIPCTAAISIRQGIECCMRSEAVIGDPVSYFPAHGKSISACFKVPAVVTCLKLAALFSGEPDVRETACRLKMSKKEAALVDGISSGSRDLLSLFRYGGGKPEILRYLKDTRDNIYPAAVLAVSLDPSAPLMSFCNRALSLYSDEVIPRLGLFRMITGDDLIREFGLSPSPAFKRILSELEDDILMGRVCTREEALRKVGDRLEKGL